MSSRLSILATVRHCGPHTMTSGATKNADGTVMFHYEEAGTRLTLEIGNADISLIIPLADAAVTPEWKKGDRLVLTLEKLL